MPLLYTQVCTQYGFVFDNKPPRLSALQASIRGLLNCRMDILITFAPKKFN